MDGWMDPDRTGGEACSPSPPPSKMHMRPAHCSDRCLSTIWHCQSFPCCLQLLPARYNRRPCPMLWGGGPAPCSLEGRHRALSRGARGSGVPVLDWLRGMPLALDWSAHQQATRPAARPAPQAAHVSFGIQPLWKLYSTASEAQARGSGGWVAGQHAERSEGNGVPHHMVHGKL